MTKREVVARLFRCPAGHKHTFGMDYLQIEPTFPDRCSQCGDPWGAGTPVYADDEKSAT